MPRQYSHGGAPTKHFRWVGTDTLWLPYSGSSRFVPCLRIDHVVSSAVMQNPDGLPSKEGDLTMTPEETVEHALSALVQGNVQGHIRYVADDVTWKLNENSAQHGKSTYQQVITAMTQDRDEMIVGFQLDGAHLDSRERVWIRTLEDRRMRWRDLAGRTGERTERVASAYRVVDGAIIEIRMTALGGSNRRFTYPPSITLS